MAEKKENKPAAKKAAEPKATGAKEAAAKEETAAKAKKSKAAPKKRLFAKSGSDKPAARIADFNLLRAPIVTEKSSLIGSQSSSGPGTALVLRVDPRASKDEIRAAIERVYKVDVLKVRTMNYMGKVKRARRSQGRQVKFKKAYVTLAEGQSVNIVEGL